MSGNCFEIGTLQAFLDGETAPELSVRISDHILECDACAARLSEAEEETAFVFAALDREIDSLVPTQRLWSRINRSIETEKERTSFWRRAYSLFAASLASPSFATAAGLLLFVGIFAFVWTSRTDDPSGVQITTVVTPRATQENGPSRTVTEIAGDAFRNGAGDTVQQTLPPVSERPQSAQAAVVNAAYTAGRRTTARGINAGDVRPATLQYIPGEESYIKTIAELEEQFDAQKDRVLPASSRVAFERDLAVVKSAIDRTRSTVRRDPGNQAARQMLYAAYQDKIDLLSTVGQREELMASLR